MKREEKNLAIHLRKQGWSMNEIKNEIGVSKSSISLWVGDIELTSEQKKHLSQKGLTKESIEKRRTTRLGRENARRQIIVDNAKKDIVSLSDQELKLIGIALYWGEGGKANRGSVQLSNGDPRIIKLMMQFFNRICKVPKEKFRAHIHIHPHLDIEKAESYWSSISGIPLNQFYKTYSKPNKSSQSKKNSLPFGTFDIYVHNTELFLKIKGWIEAVYENIV